MRPGAVVVTQRTYARALDPTGLDQATPRERIDEPATAGARPRGPAARCEGVRRVWGGGRRLTPSCPGGVDHRRRDALPVLASLVDPRSHLDVQVWRDPVPGVLDAGHAVAEAARFALAGLRHR
jgi:hypothetical protein